MYSCFKIKKDDNLPFFLRDSKKNPCIIDMISLLFQTNKSGSTIVAKADETFIIFDIVNGKICTVTPKDLKMEVLSKVAAVCPNGNHVVLSACKIVTTEEWESEPIGFLWNVQTGS